MKRIFIVKPHRQTVETQQMRVLNDRRASTEPNGSHRPSNAARATCIQIKAACLSFIFTDGLPMARWIAFDQNTTSILRSTLAQGTRIDTLLRGPVDYALARPSAVIAVLPAGGGDNLGIAMFRRVRAAAAQRAATEQVRSSLPPRPGPNMRPLVLADFWA